MINNNLNLGSYNNPITLKNKHQDIESEKYISRHSSDGVYVHRPLLQLYTGNNHEIDEDDLVISPFLMEVICRIFVV